MTDRFIGYVRLVDACDHEGCPVCACLEDDSRRELDALLYERVTDVGTRRDLRASWGLCNWHTWMLLESGGGVTGAAILYEDLVRVCQRRVLRLGDRMPPPFVRLLGWLRGIAARAPRGIVPRLIERYRERPSCPVCARLRTAETNSLDTIVRFAHDPEFSQAYRRSGGLCLPHVLAAVERAPGTAGLHEILSVTAAKWDTLRRDLERFVSKHEYRSTEAISEEEGTSYRRAFEAMAGRRNVFGNDLRRPVPAK